ncbi:MAG: tetratricopeptide repeat protein [Reyranella sp.]|jgi:tetratricopeptide (TPR) repeat protein|nr:tetratricopeptide repeat protein [Reyranella sp.]
MPSTSDQTSLPLANHDAADWPQTSSEQPAPPRRKSGFRSAIEWIAPKVPLLPRFTIGVLIVVTGLLILWATVKAVVQDVVIVEPLSIPKELEAQGYSGAVVTRRILDEVHRMSQVSQTRKERAQLGGEDRREVLANVQLPTTGLSVQTIVAILRDLFDREDTRVGGELVIDRPSDAATTPARMSLLLRTEHNNVRRARRFEAHSLDLLIELAATELLRRLDPYVLASYYYRMKAWQEMEQTIDDILASHSAPERKWALILRGNRLNDQNAKEEAIAFYDRAIDIDPKFALALVNKAIVLMDTGDYQAARALIQSAVSIDPRYHTALGVWGDLSRSHDDLDEAVLRYRQAAMAKPADPAARSRLAMAWRAIGEHREAAVEFLAAYELDPSNMDALQNLGVAFYRAGKPERMTATFEIALKRSPRSAVLNAWGDALHETGEAKAAQEKYQLAIVEDRQNDYARLQLGKLWAEQRGSEAAIEACQRMTTEGRESVAGHMLCGDLYGRLELHGEALDHYKAVVVLEPGNATAHGHCGWYYFRLGEYDAGRRHYETAMLLRPRSPSILRKRRLQATALNSLGAR